MLSDGEVRGGDHAVEIREARAEDLLSVMNINRICLPENYSYSFFFTIYESFPKAFLVADAGGSLAGYIMCRVERGFSKIETLRFRRLGHIVSVAVLPSYRRMGIGSALVLAALGALKNEYKCDEAFLEVRVTNQPAIGLYKSIGFSVVDVVRNYYVDGEDAYIMAAKL